MSDVPHYRVLLHHDAMNENGKSKFKFIITFKQAVFEEN